MNASHVFAISFILFLIIALKFGYRRSLKKIDQKIQQISDTVSAAQTALENAQQVYQNAIKESLLVEQRLDAMKEEMKFRVETFKHTKTSWDQEVIGQKILLQQKEVLLQGAKKAILEDFTKQIEDVVKKSFAVEMSTVSHRKLNEKAIAELESFLGSQAS